MKKTLLICDFYPLPENTGSNIRTMNFVRFFKKYGGVDIAYTTKQSGGEDLQEIFSNEFLLKKKDYPTGFVSRLIMFIKKIPYPIREYDVLSQNELHLLVQSGEYDYIIVRYIKNTIGLFGLPEHIRRKIIVDFDDIITNSLYRTFFKRSRNLYKIGKQNLNKALLVYYQNKCLGFGGALFCSEPDRLALTKRNKKGNAFVVPNTFDNVGFKDYVFTSGFNNGNTLLFIGTLSYLPNVNALTWFITSVFINFRKQYSDAKLLVVGSSPSSELANLCYATDGVELYPDVPDVKEYYKQCKAVIVPLLEGGGTRIKILEAALANRPILSTHQGVEGLDLHDEKELLLFTNETNFLNAYEKLLDSNIYASLVSNAEKCVLLKYSVEVFNASMNIVLNEIDNSLPQIISKKPA